MIEINLLPHREARRVADLRETVAVLVLGLVVSTGGIYFASKRAGDRITSASATVLQLEKEIKRYGPQEAQVKSFREQRESLEEKLDVIDSLERARSGPVKMMDELAKTTPERLWITSLNTKGVKIRMKGESLDTGVVADFLRSLNASVYFDDVDLDRTGRGREVHGVRLVSFVITANLVTPIEKKDEVDGDASAEQEA